MATSGRLGRTRAPGLPAGTVILSPHCDDAALSLGALIVEGRFPAPVTVVTVFTRSGFSRETGLTVAETTRMRLREERRFAEWAGVELIGLGFWDAPLRRRFGGGRSVLAPGAPPETARQRAIVQRIAGLGLDLPRRLVVGPAGHGGHVDHVMVRDAAVGLPSARTYRYVDQPYWTEDPSAVRPPAGGFLHVVQASPSTTAVKTRCAEFYASQPAAHRMVDALTQIDDGAPVEAVW